MTQVKRRISMRGGHSRLIAFGRVSLLRKPALGLIRLYQVVISPILPSSCRFYPSCSRYTYEAIDRYGLILGLFLGAKRIGRCHPFNPGGYDPVPEIDQ